MKKSLLAVVAIGGLLFSCGKKNDSSNNGGGTSPIPDMLQIAKDTLPTALESSSVSTMNFKVGVLSVDSNLDELKNRVFSPGPTDFMYRLKMVDSRLDEMATRVSDCATATTQTYTPPAVVTGMSFPMHFGCVESVNNLPDGVTDFKIYFGKDSGYWYLAEFTTNSGYATGDSEPPSMVTLAKVKEDGMEMEVWQISVERNSSNDYAGVMHLTANKSTGVFSLSTASDADSTKTNSPGANFSGLGCGINMITDGTNVYANGKFSQMASCPTTATVCATADLASTGNCSSISGSSDLLTLIARADVSGSNAKAMIIDRTGLPTF